LRDAAKQGVSAQQLMLAALETTASAATAAGDGTVLTPADKKRKLLVSGSKNSKNRCSLCALVVPSVASMLPPGDCSLPWQGKLKHL
jgi:hypothetical protein